ncbi:hypothetical protein HZD82_27470, partial [Pantoea agglomerans]|nr:hypothetical protein [Pantoea agglomerans]
EVQRALYDATKSVSGMPGEEVKQRLRTGTVVTTDDRNWELFDENAEFIEGYYIVGLLAEAFLKKEPGAKIIHDPRLTWN